MQIVFKKNPSHQWWDTPVTEAPRRLRLEELWLWDQAIFYIVSMKLAWRYKEILPQQNKKEEADTKNDVPRLSGRKVNGPIVGI